MVIKTGNDKLKKGQDSGVFMERAVYRKINDDTIVNNGIPQIIDSGHFTKENDDKDYFIVMPKFEKSLRDLKNEGSMDDEQCKKVINDVLDTLKHLTEKGYLHLDIKPDNIMFNNGRWYLIDYGIAMRFDEESEKTINKKKVGNGTPFYMARDAHKGRMSRKADLESLIYTMVDLNCQLPWCRAKNKGETVKDYLEYIFEEKQEFFKNYTKLNLPSYYNAFIDYVDKLQPGDNPIYEIVE